MRHSSHPYLFPVAEVVSIRFDLFLWINTSVMIKVKRSVLQTLIFQIFVFYYTRTMQCKGPCTLWLNSD